MDYDKIVCYCQNVTNGMIKEAVENGARTLEDIEEINGAGTVCGACIDNILQLIDEFAGQQQ